MFANRGLFINKCLVHKQRQHRTRRRGEGAGLWEAEEVVPRSTVPKGRNMMLHTVWAITAAVCFHLIRNIEICNNPHRYLFMCFSRDNVSTSFGAGWKPGGAWFSPPLLLGVSGGSASGSTSTYCCHGFGSLCTTVMSRSCRT